MVLQSGLCVCLRPPRMHRLVGFAAVQMDGPDMQAFIGFVCFFGVALPLICLVASGRHDRNRLLCLRLCPFLWTINVFLSLALSPSLAASLFSLCIHLCMYE